MLKKGDLVRVRQTVGCHMPPKYLGRGLGVVLDTKKSKPIRFHGMGEIQLGDDIAVHLGTGAVETFCSESVKVVSDA